MYGETAKGSYTRGALQGVALFLAARVHAWRYDG